MLLALFLRSGCSGCIWAAEAGLPATGGLRRLAHPGLVLIQWQTCFLSREPIWRGFLGWGKIFIFFKKISPTTWVPVCVHTHVCPCVSECAPKGRLRVKQPRWPPPHPHWLGASVTGGRRHWKPRGPTWGAGLQGRLAGEAQLAQKLLEGEPGRDSSSRRLRQPWA